jgi:hypothetical protein
MHHDYQVLFHTVPGISATIGANKHVVLGSELETAQLCLIPAEPDNIEVLCLTASQDPIQGWYSAEFGHKAPATTVIYERKTSTSTILATLAYPCSAHQNTGGRSLSASIPTLELLTQDDQSAFLAQGNWLGKDQLSGERGSTGGHCLTAVITGAWGRDCLVLPRKHNLEPPGPSQSGANAPIVAGVRVDNNDQVQVRFQGSLTLVQRTDHARNQSVHQSRNSEKHSDIRDIPISTR